MEFLKRIFNFKSKKRTYHDEIADLTVKMYRSYSKGKNHAPTSKTSDKKIIEIYSTVLSLFSKAASERNEKIPVDNLNYMALYFMQIYETRDELFFKEHLDYELNNYKKFGLRETYKKELTLF